MTAMSNDCPIIKRRENPNEIASRAIISSKSGKAHRPNVVAVEPRERECIPGIIALRMG